MNTEIYYYSGTGNSLHVARELQRRIPESNLIPIVRLLGNDMVKTSADTVGFVFPNFCLGPVVGQDAETPNLYYYWRNDCRISSVNYLLDS